MMMTDQYYPYIPSTMALLGDKLTANFGFIKAGSLGQQQSNINLHHYISGGQIQNANLPAWFTVLFVLVKRTTKTQFPERATGHITNQRDSETPALS